MLILNHTTLNQAQNPSEGQYRKLALPHQSEKNPTRPKI